MTQGLLRTVFGLTVRRWDEERMKELLSGMDRAGRGSDAKVVLLCTVQCVPRCAMRWGFIFYVFQSDILSQVLSRQVRSKNFISPDK